jgi:asparagine synthase (glutamine-hydrolysing)
MRSAPWTAWSRSTSSRSSWTSNRRRQHGIEGLVLDFQDYLPFQEFDPEEEHPTVTYLQFGAIHRAIREAARQGNIVTRLGGNGGDAVFSKDSPPLYLAEWLREWRLRDWWRELGAYIAQGHYHAWGLIAGCSAGTLDRKVGQPRRRPVTWLRPGFRRAMEEIDRALASSKDRLFESHAREFLFRCITTCGPRGPRGRALPDERLPLSYRRLVEFMLALDWEQMVRPDEDRVIMRRALRGILPEVVRTRQCKGDTGYSFFEGFRRAWPTLRHRVTGERLADLGIVEPPAFDNVVQSARGGHSAGSFHAVAAALALEIWLSHREEAGTATSATPTARFAM